MPPAPARRTAALDGLRGAAAVGVLVLHAWMFHHGDAGRPPRTALELAIGQLRLGVPFFFVLSGFLVYRPFVAAALDGRAAPGLRRFALRRAARVLPGYWLVLAVCFALTHAIGSPRAVPASALPWFLLFAQNQVAATHGRLDPPMWSLAVEVSFYALLPAVGLATARLGRRRGAQVALCLALAAVGAALNAWGALAGWPATATTSLVIALSAFAAGMTVAALLHGRGPSRRAGLALAGAGVALVGADGVWHAVALGPYAPRAAIGDLPAAAGFACVVAALAGSPLRVAPLGWRPLTALGLLSYGVYLWHMPVIYAARAAGRWPDDLAGAVGLTFAVTLALSATSWWAVERPALARVSGRRRPAGSPTPRTAPAAPAGSRPAGAAGLGAAPGLT